MTLRQVAGRRLVDGEVAVGCRDGLGQDRDEVWRVGRVLPFQQCEGGRSADGGETVREGVVQAPARRLLVGVEPGENGQRVHADLGDRVVLVPGGQLAQRRGEALPGRAACDAYRAEADLRVVVGEEVQQARYLGRDLRIPLFLNAGLRLRATASHARQEGQRTRPLVDGVHSGVREERHGRHGRRIHRVPVEHPIEEEAHGPLGPVRVTCVQSPYQLGYVGGSTVGVMARHPVDGVEFLRWSHTDRRYRPGLTPPLDTRPFGG